MKYVKIILFYNKEWINYEKAATFSMIINNLLFVLNIDC